MTWRSLSISARRVVKHILNHRFLIKTASYDVVSTVHQSLPPAAYVSDLGRELLERPPFLGKRYPAAGSHGQSSPRHGLLCDSRNEGPRWVVLATS